MSNENKQFNKSELLAELTNKHTAETSAKLDTLKRAGIETVTQLEKVQQVIKDIKMPKNLKVELEGSEVVTIKGNKGDKGDRGDKGEKGEIGNQGVRGEKGDKGDRGEKGEVSVVGVIGPIGERGPKGEKGLTGPNGKDGNDGAPDTPEEVRDKLSSLKGEERLDISAIKNLGVLRKKLAGGRVIVGAGASAKNFLSLDDTPKSYAGQESKIVRVKSTGDSLEFATAASAGHTVQNAGTDLTQRGNLNISTGLTGTDDAVNDQSDVTLDLTNVNAWTGQQYFAEATLTDGATISWNLNTAQAAKVTLAGNRTMAAPTNIVAGGTYTLFVIQDGTGSRLITWNAVFKWPAGTAPTLSTAASAIDVITFVSNGTNLYGVFQGNFS